MNLKLVFESGDIVLIGVFLSLILMSVIAWSVTIVRTAKLYKAKSALKAQGLDAPIAQQLHHAGQNALQVHQSALQSLLARTPVAEHLADALELGASQTMRRFEGGLTALATIGATAPFVGLFGTVWGIYHALINISTTGQMSISAVAGPIGEALVATAAGLFVAIPAVLAYNALVRGNKTLSQDIQALIRQVHQKILHDTFDTQYNAQTNTQSTQVAQDTAQGTIG